MTPLHCGDVWPYPLQLKHLTPTPLPLAGSSAELAAAAVELAVSGMRADAGCDARAGATGGGGDDDVAAAEPDEAAAAAAPPVGAVAVTDVC